MIFNFINFFINSDKAKQIVNTKTKYIKDDHQMNHLNKLLKEIEPLKEKGIKASQSNSHYKKLKINFILKLKPKNFYNYFNFSKLKINKNKKQSKQNFQKWKIPRSNRKLHRTPQLRSFK